MIMYLPTKIWVLMTNSDQRNKSWTWPSFTLQVDPSNNKDKEKNNLSNSIHNAGTTIEIITTTIAIKRKRKNLWD